jgi:hypothetical protein
MVAPAGKKQGMGKKGKTGFSQKTGGNAATTQKKPGLNAEKYKKNGEYRSTRHFQSALPDATN